ncbi:putative ribosomal oxygenase [Microbacterium lemovicicum]|uniref:Putative ribosomal oxygenase n=1 Tax=Microbacterium lemovicicum TaxID=1072463 RepID=A0A3Q9J2N7_9MICO|nr:cupin domain-containing protein [Microbacterium lemovicicum]AZS38565.1 putative ribosomal oxygenase [Microbacterium lemovicicum]
MTDEERGPIRRPALSRCIRVDEQVFADEYWGRRALLSTAEELAARPGNEHGFEDLFTAASVDELVTRRGVRTPFIRMAREGTVLPPSAFTASGGFGAEVGDQVASEKVLKEFAAGATIVLQGLHRLWPPIIDFTRELVADIGYPAQVNAYVTPPSSQGFSPHYDTHDVFVLQVAGEKHWVIHEPVLDNPLASQPWGEVGAEVAERAKGEPAIDAVLRPGDALYLPRGWIHSATALGDTSVHLTVGMSAYTGADVIDALLGVIRDVPDLRASLPLGVDLTDAGQLEGVVTRTVARLTEALTGADAGAVSRALSSRFERSVRPEPVAPLAAVAAAAALTAETVVRWRAGVRVRLEDAGERVRIVTPGVTLGLPVEARAALEALAQGRPITVGRLPGVDADSAVVVVRRLLREGLVVA